MQPVASAVALFVSTIVAWSVPAAGPLVVEIWPGNVPDESGNIGPERIRMSPKLDRKQVEVTEPTRMITDVTKPTITIYPPATEKNTGTAMLICPGGGYWDLFWQLEGEEVAAWLNSIGVTGIILKYRVPRRPDEPKGEPARRPLQDAQRAVSLVRSKASQWGIHPERIGIIGFSAGGHLAIATATSFAKRTYEPIDDVDKISCRPDFAIPVYSGYLKAKEKAELAPGLNIPAGTPPIFLVHGGTTSSVRRRIVCSCTLLSSGPVSRQSCTSMQGPPTISVSAKATVRAPAGLSLAPIGCATAVSFRSTQRNSTLERGYIQRRTPGTGTDSPQPRGGMCI